MNVIFEVIEKICIVSELLVYPEWYSLLCKKSLETGYINAKWQFAESLKDYNGQDELHELIFEYR